MAVESTCGRCGATIYVPRYAGHSGLCHSCSVENISKRHRRSRKGIKQRPHIRTSKRGRKFRAGRGKIKYIRKRGPSKVRAHFTPGVPRTEYEQRQQAEFEKTLGGLLDERKYRGPSAASLLKEIKSRKAEIKRLSDQKDDIFMKADIDKYGRLPSEAENKIKNREGKISVLEREVDNRLSKFEANPQSFKGGKYDLEQLRDMILDNKLDDWRISSGVRFRIKRKRYKR